MRDKCETEIWTGSCRGCGGTNLYQVVTLPDGGGIQVGIKCRECGWGCVLPHLENLRKRTNASLIRWSVQVRKRDGHCVVCGSFENLQAHHIIPASVDRSLYLNIGNGVTLCGRCHLMAHRRPQQVETLQEESRWTDGREENVVTVPADGSEQTLRELTEQIVHGAAGPRSAVAPDPESPEALLPLYGNPRVRQEDGKLIVRLDGERWEYDIGKNTGRWVPDLPADGEG